MGKQRPNALILGYPCILSDLDLAFSVRSLEQEVDNLTPSTFLFTTFEDRVVPIEHSLSFMQALNSKNIRFESHIFQNGVHGLSLAKPLSSSGLKSFVDQDFAQWFDLSISWLHNLFGNFLAEKESAIPEAKDAKQYSIQVQIGSLLDHPECRKVILKYLPIFVDDTALDSARAYSLKMINQYLPEPIPETMLLDIDKQLREIPFID